METRKFQTPPESTENNSLPSRSEEPWQVLIHNDDETPFGYVIHTLNSVFMLSDELSEHIATTAHEKGTAVVAVRPQSEAEKYMRVALGRAKSDGYPLQFSVQKR